MCTRCVPVCHFSSLIPGGGAGTLSRTGSTRFSQLSAVLQLVRLKCTSAPEGTSDLYVDKCWREPGLRAAVCGRACLRWLLDQSLSARTRKGAPPPCQGQAVPSRPVGHPSGSPPPVSLGTITLISLPCITVCPAGPRTPGGQALCFCHLCILPAHSWC